MKNLVNKVNENRKFGKNLIFFANYSKWGTDFMWLNSKG